MSFFSLDRRLEPEPEEVREEPSDDDEPEEPARRLEESSRQAAAVLPSELAEPLVGFGLSALLVFLTTRDDPPPPAPVHIHIHESGNLLARAATEHLPERSYSDHDEESLVDDSPPSRRPYLHHVPR